MGDVTAGEAGDIALPSGPVTFHTLLHLLGGQALLSLGLIPGPDGKLAQPNLKLARHLIDLIDVVERKSRGNREPEEERAITALLTGLRMRVVESEKG